MEEKVFHDFFVHNRFILIFRVIEIGEINEFIFWNDDDEINMNERKNSENRINN